MSNKKGISSLIITVLLVAISIGLGSLVIGWVTSSVSSNVAEARAGSLKITGCKDISYTVWKTYLYTNGTPNLYNNISFYIENKGTGIAGFVLKIKDDANNLLYEPQDFSNIRPETFFNPSEKKWIYFYCSKCSGNISFVELIPLYRAESGNLDLCGMNTRSYEAFQIEKR
ncbi:MAG: hypothetical protein QXR30_02180 [Candidatus Woesearchaeota archaeon]